MPNNYVLLERFELTANTASVTFDNLPTSGYTDLKVVVSARAVTDTQSAPLLLSFNGNTSNLTSRRILGTGGSAISQTGSGNSGIGGVLGNGSDFTANVYGSGEIYIPNYRSSTFKSISIDSTTENNASGSYLALTALLWSSTAAITSITLTQEVGNIAAGSSFALYGMAAVGTTPAIAPKADGGNIIATDGTFWYHAFLANGTFTPQVGLTCDYLVVAGGGGGGFQQGGGGGAGGLRSTVTATGGGGALESALTVNAQTSYAITVGAGGAGRTTGGAAGASGTNSTFSTITSTGGGGGGSNSSVGLSGGSGGGGSINANAGGTGAANQGRNGGTGDSSVGGGGGGGGANTAGTNANGNGGVGGNGVTISAFATPTGTGVSNVYAGGGGGGANSGPGYSPGAGGSGGGGAGSASTTAAGTGLANTGSGGGGSGQNAGTVYTNAGAGGSGIVIIRYPITA